MFAVFGGEAREQDVVTYIQEGVHVKLGHLMHKDTGSLQPGGEEAADGGLDPASVGHVPHDI